MTTLVAALAWVPQGYAASQPKKYVLNDEEYARISALAQLQLDDAKEDAEEVSDTEEKEETSEKADQDDLKAYNLDTYDDDEGGAESDTEPAELGIFSNVKGLSYYSSNEEDPYITLKDVSLPESSENAQSDDEREELEILPTDNLIVAAKTEDDVSYLETYVYESAQDNIYVHHDIMLPSFPLCVEWLNYNVNSSVEDDGTRRGNMVAVGTFDPDIEIWDLDTVEGVYPDAILGLGADKGKEDSTASTNGDKESKNQKKKKKKKRKAKGPGMNDKFHVDAVMCLSANALQRNLLLSGSADTTVKLWDLKNGSTSACVQSFSFHKDKISALEWHPTEAYYALSGSYDRSVMVADFRIKDGSGARWSFQADIEGVKWDPLDSNLFYVSTENGILHHFDARMHSPTTQKALWLLQAHDSGLSSFDISPTHRGLIVTGSADKLVKLWHVAPDARGPSLVLSKDLDLGKIFSTRFGPDKEVAMKVAVAGSAGSIKVWDLSSSNAARRAFGVAGRVDEVVEGKVVGITEDKDEEEDEGEDGGDGWENMDDD